jgi:hypothetical protein
MEKTAAPIRIVRLFIQAAAAEANSKSIFATTRHAALISINARGMTMTGTMERRHLRNTVQQQPGELWKLVHAAIDALRMINKWTLHYSI